MLNMSLPSNTLFFFQGNALYLTLISVAFVGIQSLNRKQAHYKGEGLEVGDKKLEAKTQ